MREIIRKVLLVVATLLIMAFTFEGHTIKVYSAYVDEYGQTWFSGDELQPGGAQDQYTAALVQTEGYTWIDAPPSIATPTQPLAPAPTKTPKPTPTKTPEAPKEKIRATATFKNLYGVIIGTSKITKGTDIAKSQFPKKVPDIETSKGTYVFERWDYDGSVLTDDISVKAVYKLVKK